MKLTHIFPVFIFECEISEKNIPKGSGFKFNRFASKKWATDDILIARRLVQYADDSAKNALSAAGVNMEKALKSAISRAKKLSPHVQVETDRKKLAQIEQWLGYVELKAAGGYIYQSGLEALRMLHAEIDPATKMRIEAAIVLAEKVAQNTTAERELQTLSKQAELSLGWIQENINGGSWYRNAEARVRESAAAMRLFSPSSADSILDRLGALRHEFDVKRSQIGGTYSLVTSDRVGGLEYNEGQLLRNEDMRIEGGEPTWLIVVNASKKLFAMEMGDRFDCRPGWEFYADCRPATPEEIALAAAGYEECQAEKQFIRGNQSENTPK